MVKTVVTIDGMACGMCEAHVNDSIRSAFAVKKVVSSHKKGIAELLTEDTPDRKKLIQAIEANGYRVVSVQSEPVEKKGFSLFRR